MGTTKLARKWRKQQAVNLYVALLRAINVGGNNLIPMPELKVCFEAQGFRDVMTYIQSGNVLFRTTRRSNHPAFAQGIEQSLSQTFTYRACVVVRSFEQMRAVVDTAPKGFGRLSALHRYDVIFLKEPLTAAEALKSMTAKPGVDRLSAGDGVLYASRLISRAAQSHLSRVVGKPIYQSMTIRSWNTTRKLLELMERIRTAPGNQTSTG